MPLASIAPSSPDPMVSPQPEASAIAVPRNWTTSPTLPEVILLALLTALLFAATILPVQTYRSTVDNFGDSPAYISVASAIQHWDFQGPPNQTVLGIPLRHGASFRAHQHS